MVTKADAKKAWQTVMSFSMSHNNAQSFSKNDITQSMQNAIKVLNDYFTHDEGDA